jgi:hypothetical protein
MQRAERTRSAGTPGLPEELRGAWFGPLAP